MGGLTDCRIVHVEIGADGPNHHLAGVQAHPDADRDAVIPTYALGIPLHRLLHPQGGVARPHRVVFVRERRAEQCHDAIAHDLVHRALVAVDGLHHVLENRIEELPRLLGIAIGEQLHRALQVSEEHGDLLALAFQSGLRSEDLLGEVLRAYRSPESESGSVSQLAHRTPSRTSPIPATRLGTSSRSMPGAHRTPGKTWLGVDSRAGTGDTACRKPPSASKPGPVGQVARA